ncbi:MAG: ESPR domain-containing protein, partial [Acidaminococcaceae bacterium]|nr:ESPR domain-containing protein [Acidaminococcaceae bacterium]
MNKIYKVVWSKAKHCYVVTSELAKRQTKGCGARSLRMAAVSVGVAAALIGGVGFGSPVAEAADPQISGSVTKGGVTKNFTQANFIDSSGNQQNYGYGNGFFDGESATPPTEAKGYAVNITSAPNWRVFVGAGIPYGTISDNSVTVNGDSINITQEVIGGSAYGEETGTKTSTLTKNSVTVNGGT